MGAIGLVRLPASTPGMHGKSCERFSDKVAKYTMLKPTLR